MFYPFRYPGQTHSRRHGPAGYLDYRSFKPWLRDEFTFRCVFCLLRERWSPLGADSFGVDHVIPRSQSAELEQSYGNLVYACSSCNSAKQERALPIDPCQEPYGAHVRVREDGLVEPLSAAGAALVDRLNLNRDALLRCRRDMLWLVARAVVHPEGDLAVYVRSLMAYPVDLPDLASLRPPGGNTRPDGLQTCYFAQQQRGQLPATY
jgi:hypothetical protein